MKLCTFIGEQLLNLKLKKKLYLAFQVLLFFKFGLFLSDSLVLNERGSSIRRVLAKLFVIHYDNKNRGFTRLSITKKKHY
jgi:hypothetical protein